METDLSVGAVQEHVPSDSHTFDTDRSISRDSGSERPERQDLRQPRGGDVHDHQRDQVERSRALRDTIVDAAYPDGDEPEGIRVPKEERQPQRRPALREPEGEREEAPQQATAKPDGAPASWSREAREMWRDLPQRARDEIVKREQQMQQGVNQLKDRYKEVDAALAPHLETIRRFQKRPGEAVSQLFSWFNALDDNAPNAFPALVDSYKIDRRQMVDWLIPGAVAEFNWMRQSMINAIGLENFNKWRAQAGGRHQQQVRQQQLVQQQYQQRVNAGVQQQMAPYYQQARAENARRTVEYLENWSRDKPHFEKVRLKMAAYITPDSSGHAAVPLLPDGRIDLDGAYLEACWANPNIRKQMIREERQAAERQREQNRLRYNAVNNGSISPSGSGPPGRSFSRDRTPEDEHRGLSVRQSLYKTIEDLASS